MTLLGLSGAPCSDSAPGELCPPCPPRYAPDPNTCKYGFNIVSFEHCRDSNRRGRFSNFKHDLFRRGSHSTSCGESTWFNILDRKRMLEVNIHVLLSLTCKKRGAKPRLVSKRRCAYVQYQQKLLAVYSFRIVASVPWRISPLVPGSGRYIRSGQAASPGSQVFVVNALKNRTQPTSFSSACSNLCTN